MCLDERMSGAGSEKSMERVFPMGAGRRGGAGGRGAPGRRVLVS